MNPVYHYDIIQGTDEWKEIRRGKITGSKFKTLLVNGTKHESGLGVGAIKELYRIVEERITGRCRESFSNKATDWGHEFEPEAREHFEHENFVRVEQCGFVERNEWTGVSPDGLIGDDEGIEIKCFPTGFMEVLETGKYGKDEYNQCQVNMWVTGRNKWHLNYYHPWFPDNIKSKSFVFEPDLKLFKKFEEREKIFIEEVQKKLKNYLK